MFENIQHPDVTSLGEILHLKLKENLEEDVKYQSEKLKLSIFTQYYNNKRQDSIPLHWHENDVQIFWVDEGTLEVQISDEIIIVPKGNLLVINQKEYHQARSIGGDTKTLCIMFRFSLFNPDLVDDYLCPVFKNDNFTYSLLQPAPIINQRIKKVKESTQSEINYLSVTTLVSLILEQLIDEGNLDYIKSNPEDKKIFNILLEYINDNYPNDIVVDDLCNVGSINKNYCTDLFHRYTGTTPMKYVNEYRLYKARLNVINTNRSIEAICHESGFNNLSYFSTQFKNKFQLSPMQYRKKYQ